MDLVTESPSLFGDTDDGIEFAPAPGCEPLPPVPAPVEAATAHRVRKRFSGRLYQFDAAGSPSAEQRNQAAWRLAASCHPMACGFARRLATQPCDFDDLVQDVMLSLFASGRRYDPILKTRYTTTAYTWAFRQAKSSWDAKHRRGMTGGVRPDEVPTLFTDPRADADDSPIDACRGREREPSDVLADAEWHLALPADPPWVRTLARLKYQEGLRDGQIRRKLRVQKPEYADMLARLKAILASHFGVDLRGRSARTLKPGTFARTDAQSWWAKWAAIPESRGDVRDAAYHFFRRGESIRQIARDYGGLAAEVEELIDEAVAFLF